jgi:hypothetical protein
MTVPIVFRDRGERILTSYSYTDLTTGIAYKNYYGCKLDGGAFVLLGSPLSSTLIASTQGMGSPLGTSDALRQEFDFDLDIGKPQQVKGPLFVDATYFARNVNGSLTFVIGYIKVRIYHVDSSNVETEIGAQITATEQPQTDNTIQVVTQQATFKYDIDKRFKADEKLRVNIELWGSAGGSSSNSNAVCGLCHDPFNQPFNAPAGFPIEFQGNTARTDLLVSIPFKADI